MNQERTHQRHATKLGDMPPIEPWLKRPASSGHLGTVCHPVAAPLCSARGCMPAAAPPPPPTAAAHCTAERSVEKLGRDSKGWSHLAAAAPRPAPPPLDRLGSKPKPARAPTWPVVAPRA